MDPETKTRSYAYSAYGAPARERPNLQIITEAQARKVLFTDTSAKLVQATGVELEIEGKVEMFTAAKEIILAAGVFNTPKLLELSGIGGQELLGCHGIRVHVDLPGVGEGFQDHLMTGLSYEAADEVVTGDPLLRQEPEALAQKLYAEHRAGPFAVGTYSQTALSLS